MDNMQQAQEIGQKLKAAHGRRAAIEREIRALKAEEFALWDNIHEYDSLLYKLVPDVWGKRFPVPNDMPEDFSNRELAAKAHYQGDTNDWTVCIEEVYDGMTGTSDPMHVMHHFATAALAIAAGDIEAERIALKLREKA